MKENQSLSLFDNDSIKRAEETYELVQVVDGQAMTSSLLVAEYFKKQHKDVLKSINSLECSELFRKRNFSLSNYTRTNGNITKSYPMYYLTRDGFTLLAMGFTGKIAVQFKENYINAFNLMEEALRRSGSMKFANSVLKVEVNRLNMKMRKSISKGQEKYGIGYGPEGCLFSRLPFLDDEDFERNIRNIFSHLNNAFIDSFFFVNELKKKDEIIDKMKRALEAIRLDAAKILGY